MFFDHLCYGTEIIMLQIHEVGVRLPEKLYLQNNLLMETVWTISHALQT